MIGHVENYRTFTDSLFLNRYQKQNFDHFAHFKIKGFKFFPNFICMCQMHTSNLYPAKPKTMRSYIQTAST